MNRLTDISAQELLRRRGRVARHDIVLRPLWRLFRSLVVDRAILEGWAGLYVAVTGAFYVYLKYAKAAELEHTGDQSYGVGSSK